MDIKPEEPVCCPQLQLVQGVIPVLEYCPTGQTVTTGAELGFTEGLMEGLMGWAETEVQHINRT